MTVKIITKEELKELSKRWAIQSRYQTPRMAFEEGYRAAERRIMRQSRRKGGTEDQ